MNKILSETRLHFQLPRIKNNETIYFCGNSLGLMPKNIIDITEQYLSKWANEGVEGHFSGQNQWVDYHKKFENGLARLVGASISEVVAMNSLSVNLHLLFATFYQPTKKKYKIAIDSPSFSSDKYAIDSILKSKNLDPANSLIEIQPDHHLKYTSTESLLETIENNHQHLALVWLNGVNYYNGQLYEIEKIAKKCQEYNIIIGLDLAHAIANVPLKLHDWKIDFAVWCSYKYLNAGPGSVGGAFVHQKWAENTKLPRLAGWWGHKIEDRFEMKSVFDPSPTAESWQLSNAPIMNMLGLQASLSIFDTVDLDQLFLKSNQFFDHLCAKLNAINTKNQFQIITPQVTGQHGAQLSIYFKNEIYAKIIFDFLNQNNIIIDFRKPSVLRISPVPMYNTIEEIDIFIQIFEKGLKLLN